MPSSAPLNNPGIGDDRSSTWPTVTEVAVTPGELPDVPDDPDPPVGVETCGRRGGGGSRDLRRAGDEDDDAHGECDRKSGTWRKWARQASPARSHSHPLSVRVHKAPLCVPILTVRLIPGVRTTSLPCRPVQAGAPRTHGIRRCRAEPDQHRAEAERVLVINATSDGAAMGSDHPAPGLTWPGPGDGARRWPKRSRRPGYDARGVLGVVAPAARRRSAEPDSLRGSGRRPPRRGRCGPTGARRRRAGCREARRRARATSDTARSAPTNARASATGTRVSLVPWTTKNGGASALTRRSGDAASNTAGSSASLRLNTRRSSSVSSPSS